MLMDEPTSSLDPAGRSEVLDTQLRCLSEQRLLGFQDSFPNSCLNAGVAGNSVGSGYSASFSSVGMLAGLSDGLA